MGRGPFFRAVPNAAANYQPSTSLMTLMSGRSHGCIAVCAQQRLPEQQMDQHLSMARDLGRRRRAGNGEGGAPMKDYRKYGVLLLIGLSIGATPLISIIKDVLNNISDVADEEQLASSPSAAEFMTRCLYFYWCTREDVREIATGRRRQREKERCGGTVCI